MLFNKMDSVSLEKRSWVMAQVKGRDTWPEKAVRSLLHHMGYRFRLQRKDLPGKPDIVLPKYRTVIFVHGCYWHRHPGCKRATTPATHNEYWDAKFICTVSRDERNKTTLESQGWRVVVVWECELKDPVTLNVRLQNHFAMPRTDGA
jgi:DNA mismatch endonuclease (patch repair protein)